MWGQRLAVCGSIPELGDWDPAHSFLLSDVEYPLWKGTLTMGSEPISFSYLLVYQDPAGGPHRFIRWEQGERRHLSLTTSACIHHRLDEPPWGTVEPSTHDVSLASKRVSLELPSALKPQNAVLLGNITPHTKEKKHVSFSPKLIASMAAEEVTPETRRHRKKFVTFSRCVESPSGVDFLNKYEESFTVLGTGGMCGNVYMATRRSDLLDVAVKILHTTGMTNTQERNAMSEVRNHLSMSHPNICSLLEVFEEPGRLRLVMERLRGPDLYDYWNKRGSFSEREAVNYTRQISSAVAYCHSVGVCHRDLKLENVCLEDDSHDADVKLIDFGLSVDVTQVPTLVGAVGTLYYMAPEVWQGQYDEMCDMWSLGILTYILLDGGPPFEHEDDDVVKRLICTGDYVFHDNPWKHISGKAIHFVASLLIVEASKRLDAQAAANHIWLAQHEKAASLQHGAPDMEAAELRDLLPAPLSPDCATRKTRKRLPTKHASNRILTKISFGGMA